MLRGLLGSGLGSDEACRSLEGIAGLAAGHPVVPASELLEADSLARIGGLVVVRLEGRGGIGLGHPVPPTVEVSEQLLLFGVAGVASGGCSMR